jgi:hypothetical protein
MLQGDHRSSLLASAVLFWGVLAGAACDLFALSADPTVDYKTGGAGGAGTAMTGSGSSASPCSDGKQNGDETDIDCGGSCLRRCDNGQSCNISNDCESGLCPDKTCRPPSCSDMAKNGTETDVDCGGMCGSTCGDGKDCTSPSDCKSGVCTGNKCDKPSCSDGVKNGEETGSDCGGPCTLKCYGDPCTAPGDCNSNACGGGLCRFAAGVRCIEGAECASIFCAADGTCVACTMNEQCKSQQCDVSKGICAIEDGAPCGVDVACFYKRCTNGLCALPTNTNCTTATECVSHVCGGAPGKCAICTKDRDCGDADAGGGGQCDTSSTGNCFLPDGAYCDRLSTGQCLPGKICDGFPARCLK